MWQAQVRNRLLGVSLLMHMNLPDDLQEKFEVTSCILVLLSNMSSETMAFAECDRSACEDFWKWQWMRTLKSHSCTLRCKRVTYVWRLTWCYKKSCKARCDWLCSHVHENSGKTCVQCQTSMMKSSHICSSLIKSTWNDRTARTIARSGKCWCSLTCCWGKLLLC